MDILCPKCAEPWEIDSLHEVAEDHGGFDAAYKSFRTQGCGVAFSSWGTAMCNPVDRPELYELADLLGDDVDGYAAMIEDFGL